MKKKKAKKNKPTHIEFLKVSEAAQIFSLSRSTIYELIKERAIRTINLRKRGASRGCRLIHYDSLRDYLLSFEEGPKN